MTGSGTDAAATCRVDLHVKVLDEAVVDRAKRRGIDVLVYAPHFTRLPEIRERAAAFSDDELLVVPGREIFTGTWRDRKHVLAVGLDAPIPDFITLDAAMAAIADQDAVALVPHPEFMTVSLTEDDVARHSDVVAAVETYNPKHLSRHNERACEVAEAVDVPRYASSYAHLPGTVGEVWSGFETAIDDEGDLVAALQDGAERRLGRRGGLDHAVRCRAEFAHLAWENSWKKVDRVLLSGMEPTHPRHVAYDGRYDDVTVY